MSTMKTTIIGMNNYMSAIGDDLFKFLTVPEGVNKQTLIDRILLDGGEFESLFSNPYFVQKSIGTWSAINQKTFEKWVIGVNLEYNPIENYDRFEEYSDTESATSLSNMIGSSTGTETSSNTNVNNTTDNLANLNEHKVTPFDTNNYVNDYEDTGHNNRTVNGTITDNATVSNTSSTSSDVTGTNNRTLTHTAHLHGNIGVTSNEQMQKDYLDLANWSLYQHITDMFIQEFCIMVYL